MGDMADYYDDRAEYDLSDLLGDQQSKSSKSRKLSVPKNNKSKSGKYLMECHCGAAYVAKGADIGRGWGFSCSKRCAAIRREYGKKRAKILDKL